MKTIETYTYENVSYPVQITRKKVKNITYRFSNGVFKITAPYMVSMAQIEKGLIKFVPKFIEHQKPSAMGDNFNYILGIKTTFSSSGEVKFSDGSIIKYKSIEDFDKKMKKLFLSLITTRVRYYEKRMMLTYHNVRVRTMTSRYGSNSKYTHTVTFNYNLYHYSIDIIDAIIVHELAHSIVYNHSKNFYEVVYKYCPDYDNLHKKLGKGMFQ